MRVALVNDLKIALAALQQVVVAMPGVEVAWMAEDGEEAVRRCRADTPDLILMDLIMPVMNGMEATRRIMKECPCSIVVVTATVEGNAQKVYEALGHGALDAVNTPVLGTCGDLSGAEDLVRKIRTIERLIAPAPTASGTASPAIRPVPSPQVHRTPTFVAIGASTGGPQALLQVLSALPRPLKFSVTIVQHIDLAFGPGLASWLTNETGVSVEVVESGQSPSPGRVYLASTEDHLIIDPKGLFRYVREPADHVYRPSVDVFFKSLLSAPVEPGTAVLLTGMGRDGAAALLTLMQAGWHTIVQDESTSVVWGMPGAAARLGAAMETLPVDAIGAAITRRMKKVKNARRRGPS